MFAWRLRKPDGLPLLLESTADVVDVVLQEESGGLRHNALRLLYAAAISRFVTGLADTQIDLTRDRPSWFPPGHSLQLPLALLQVRHRIVHRHLPSLAELKRAATESLAWLWEWYWSQLDHAFSTTTPTTTAEPPRDENLKQHLQPLLKTYVKACKTALKTRKTSPHTAATHALNSYTTLRHAAATAAVAAAADAATAAPQSPPSTRLHDTLLQLLVHNSDAMLLPADKQLGAPMSGAFLIWTPFLVAFCTADPAPILAPSTLLAHLMRAMNAASAVHDARREGLLAWVVYLLGADKCAALRGGPQKRLVEEVLARCLSEPGTWNLKLAQRVVREVEWQDNQDWRAVLDALGEEEREAGDGNGSNGVDEEGDPHHHHHRHHLVVAAPQEPSTGEESVGPRKVLGMWKPLPIGWLPPDFEEDE